VVDFVQQFYLFRDLRNLHIIEFKYSIYKYCMFDMYDIIILFVGHDFWKVKTIGKCDRLKNMPNYSKTIAFIYFF